LSSNKALALARAETVKDELVRLGVPQDEIAVTAASRPVQNPGVKIVTE